ncbi:MAG: fumarylacetoacetate hydrolase family protein [Rhizobiales bacterium]|nr:fumarylacetoacetate hydrolase family protein [Hyphomicrobiales bacterium]OJY43706.1 MAG: 2-hydroxyhepta-2,4-diene-1,7-dioate isomerase [Rhizobiales bacterium 64-17]
MRLARFDDDRLGLVRNGDLLDVSEALEILPRHRWPLPYGDPLITHLGAVLERVRAIAPRAQIHKIDSVKLLSPVANASKIIAAPVNYLKHVAEARADAGIHFGADIKTIDHYGLFLKSNTSVIGAGEPIIVPNIGRRVDHEIEVAVVIGKNCKDVSEAEALSVVCGYAMALDMSVRGLEDRSWRKSYDSFSVIGPWLVTADEIADSAALNFEISVNGERRQHSNTRKLIFSIPKLIAYASTAYRLYPGDIIMTGTPEGVGPVTSGDRLTCRVDGIGTMNVRVA